MEAGAIFSRVWWMWRWIARLILGVMAVCGVAVLLLAGRSIYATDYAAAQFHVSEYALREAGDLPHVAGDRHRAKGTSTLQINTSRLIAAVRWHWAMHLPIDDQTTLDGPPLGAWHESETPARQMGTMKHPRLISVHPRAMNLLYIPADAADISQHAPGDPPRTLGFFALMLPLPLVAFVLLALPGYFTIRWWRRRGRGHRGFDITPVTIEPAAEAQPAA